MHQLLKYFAISLLLILNTDLFSQDSKFNAGILFNANGIHIQGQDVTYWSGSEGTIWGTGGLSLGGYVKRNFTDHIYASLELRYIRKGSIYEFLTDYGLHAYEVLKLNYIEMPILFGYKIRPNNKYRLFETGIAIAKLFSSDLEINELTQRKGTPESGDFKDIDFSWVGSVKFPLNRKKGNNLLFGLRVVHSILSIHKQYKLYNFDYGIQLDFLL